ncbi:hypothetical protein RUM8411_04145 [Ruegeria meonggei]|uniref:Uncharacterized protein n=1 Tax=Ruegeria meonggei TaxID=1446476 RepID=A0A1X7ACE0_9RHOB|nr:hypothetical protein RUM8411_04145 [Ruegeria meonggei]
MALSKTRLNFFDQGVKSLSINLLGYLLLLPRTFNLRAKRFVKVDFKTQ